MLSPEFSPFTCLVEPVKRNKNRVRPRYESQDVEKDGQIVRETTIVYHDYSVPFTPQKGIECQAHDLATMAKHAYKIEHKACYMSQLGTNPIALQRIASAQAAALGKAVEEVKSKSNSKSK